MTNGCHNRPPFCRVTPVQDGWFLDGDTRVPRMAPSPHRMTADCQYTLSDLGATDAGCTGCKWQQQPKGRTTDGN